MVARQQEFEDPPRAAAGGGAEAEKNAVYGSGSSGGTGARALLGKKRSRGRGGGRNVEDVLQPLLNVHNNAKTDGPRTGPRQQKACADDENENPDVGDGLGPAIKRGRRTGGSRKQGTWSEDEDKRLAESVR